MKRELLDEYERLYDNRDYESLIKTCEDILKRDNDNQTAMGYRICALMCLDRDEEALRYSDEALKIHPENFRFHFFRAETLLWAFDDNDGAIDAYEKGLAMVDDLEDYWGEVQDLLIALNQKADELTESGDFKRVVETYEKILFYKPDKFEALDKIDFLVKKHNIDYVPGDSYSKSLKLRKNAQKKAEKIKGTLKAIEIGEYDEEYVEGLSEFGDYSSIDEYVRDLIIYLMESYPHRTEEAARHLVKCNMDYVKSSYEHKEPISICSIEVGYCCG